MAAGRSPQHTHTSQEATDRYADTDHRNETINLQRVFPAHPVVDQAHVDEIAASMRVSGWLGAPLVVISDKSDGPLGIWCGELLTGTHRTAAWRQAHADDVEDSDLGIPLVTLDTLYARLGIDYQAALAEWEPETIQDVREMVVRTLPGDVLVAYGIEDQW